VLAVLTLALLLPVVRAQSGDGYNLTWWTIDTGGACISGGGYALMGTVGQPDPSPALTGGGFVLNGGFWPGGLPLRYPLYLPVILHRPTAGS
jgi:hypothetical protein